jgi:hypothetical protein
MTDQRDPKNKKKEESPEKKRNPYLKPLLIQYGHIEELTQTGGATTLEGFARKAPRN